VPGLAFVLCSIDAAKRAAVTADIARLAGGPYEVAVVGDARSLCEGWTRGLAQVRAERVVFCHDDIGFLVPDLALRARAHLDRHDLVGVAGTRRCVGMDWAEAGIEHAYGAIVHAPDARATFCFYGAGPGGGPADRIEALDGVFIAARRTVAERIGFDAATFDGFHGYDADFSFRAHRAGFGLAVALDLPLVHRSTGTIDAARARYHARFAEKHAAMLAQGRGAWTDTRLPLAAPADALPAFEPASLEAMHSALRERAAALEAAASVPGAAPRNAPCPCGSGLRYRDCHGAIDRGGR